MSRVWRRPYQDVSSARTPHEGMSVPLARQGQGKAEKDIPYVGEEPQADTLMKNIEGQFEAVSKDGQMMYLSRNQVEGYCRQYEGQSFIVTFQQKDKLSDKQRMYNFLYGPLLDCAVKALEDMGYDGMDKVIACHMLRDQFAKDYILNLKTNDREPYLLEIGRMSKDRLLKFINDSIYFIEQDLSHPVPDSQQYKEMMLQKRRK